MKTVIASKGKDLTSQVDERFGRADYFLITDDSGEKIEDIIENMSKNDTTGAGTGAASLIAEKGARVLIAGNLGPKAENVINAAGIKFISFTGTVLQAIESIKGKDMKNIESDLSDYDDRQSFSADSPKRGMGQGRGMGQRGMCQGQGGRGMGGGQGRGACRGGGRGMGRSAGKGMGRNAGRI